MTKRETAGGLLASLLIAAVPGAETAYGQGLAALETADQRLIYVDPLQNFLVPHAARCYQNALQTHQRIMGFAPEEKATVFLRDFSDHGNAFAGAVPRNTLLFDIAPMRYTFETIIASERMCNQMNHELVHVITSDQATAALSSISWIPHIPTRAFSGRSKN